MSDRTAQEPVRVERLEDGALWHVSLCGGKGNVIDTGMSRELTRVVQRAAASPGVKAVVLDGAGPHFSFGASVQEHLPEHVVEMLAAFHGVFRAMADSALVFLAVVRGRCLGGGLELASFCHRVFASPDAGFGQPEIRLGVFAPVASLLLAGRIGRGAAEDLCLTGRTVPALEALAMGLVDTVADDPFSAALEYARTGLLPHSAASLRFATRALRHGVRARLDTELAAIERLYLEELMASADAVEGVRAFLDKRAPVWRNA